MVAGRNGSKSQMNETCYPSASCTAHKLIIDEWIGFYLFCLRSSDHDLKTDQRLKKKDAQGTFLFMPLRYR